MKLKTKYEPIEDRPHPMLQELDENAHQWLFRFDNGYGASVVWSPFTTQMRAHGFELAVIHFTDAVNWKITYDTPITDDVVNGLGSYHVEEILQRIESLDLPQQIVSPEGEVDDG